MRKFLNKSTEAEPGRLFLQDLEQRLRGAGYKLTRPRRAIMEVVAQAGVALSPGEILERARVSCPSVGLATVYRTLEVLDRIGGAERLGRQGTGSGSRTGFVACPATDHHHIVCRVCGRVAEFEGCMVSLIASEVQRQTGFTVEGHTLELLGRCKDCRRGEASDA